MSAAVVNYSFLGLFILTIVIMVVGLWKASRKLKEIGDQSQEKLASSLLQQQMTKMETQLTGQLDRVNAQMSEKLNESSQVLRDTHRTMGERLDSATQIMGAVQGRLGKLEEANRQIYEVGKDISSLQELLRAPTFRGEMGEFLLENLLSQLLPAEHFSMQHTFKSGETVDAVIRLGGKLVPIDSKFPLENFKKMVESQDEAEKKAAQRKFAADVKRRIDEIAKKYILPDENTFEFALMYIPAENVYYETIIKEESSTPEQGISAYALAQKVIPTSPNSLYAYLQAILMGLKGMKIEKNAQAIVAGLGRLSTDLARFQEDFQVMGKHLANTRNKYEDAEKKLGRFTDKLVGVGEESLALEEPKSKDFLEKE